MPNYDYICRSCKKRFLLKLSYQEYDAAQVICPHCSSREVQRKIGRIRVMRSEGSRLSDLADPDALDQIDDDPQALGKMMRRMSSELGEDMGSEFNEVVDRLESGQNPDQIERELPDLGESTDRIESSSSLPDD